MAFKAGKSFVVRFVLILILLGGMPGTRNVEAASLQRDNTTVLVTVQDTDGLAAVGLNVYAFNGSTYTGFHGVTDLNGQLFLSLPLGSYRFRADLNGTQFWSGTTNHCEIPSCDSAGVTVSKPMTVTVLDTDGAPKVGLYVYAFNGSTYTGYNKTTDVDGQAVFTLPLGSYRFRADLNGTQFWSGATNHCEIPGCDSASVTVSKPMTVTVLDTDGAPKAGLYVYAFNGSTYTGYNKTTDVDGQAVFTLPLGSYRFRADLNGTQFWSGATNHCEIPGCDSAQITVSIPVTMAIQDGGGAPKAGVNVYAFNGSTYTGYNKVSDTNGQAVFTLPLGSYRFRADYSGTQYWSGSTNHCTLPGCLSASLTVGPAMTATFTPTATTTPTSIPTFTLTPTSTSTSTPRPSLVVVTTLADSGPGSLRQAIAEAASGATIRFASALAGGTITLSSNLVIIKSVTIDGSGLSPQLTISGGNVAHITIDSPLNSTVTISDLTIVDGYTSGDGGAIFSPIVNLIIINSTLRNNHAAGDGGAIFSYGRLTLKNTTISQNQADADGGAFAFTANAYRIDIVNSTVSQNQAGNQGGAIYMEGDAAAAIYNSTFAGNEAIEGHELWLQGNSALYLSNTVFVCGPVSNCYYQVGLAAINVMNSILGSGTLSGYGLAELADNGGPTQTMALLPTSSLIDAGSDAMCAGPLVSNLDQRGVTRLQGAHCDIGAYEYEGVPVPTFTPTSTSTVTPTSTYTPTSVSTLTSTPTSTLIATYTPTSTPSLTSTPTATFPTSTPVLGCNNITWGALTRLGSTMRLTINNPTPYTFTVGNVFVTWNHDQGHIGSDKTLRLQSAQLGSIFWTGNQVGPSFTIVPSTTVTIPNGTSTIIFTFHQTYTTWDNTEEIMINLSTPGCEIYPIHAVNH